MNAAAVKAALRRRHPAFTDGIPGPWTCLDEWANIDLLAVSAWATCRPFPRYARVGYEVKVSRSDFRRELGNPGKRLRAVACCHEFYLAVPEGLMKDEELAWVPPPGFTDEVSPFDGLSCPGTHGAACTAGSVKFGVRDPRDDATRRRSHYWGGDTGVYLLDFKYAYSGPCPTCRGTGNIADSPASRAGAPYLWVPEDVGLVTVNPDTGKTTTVRKAPRRIGDPAPLVTSVKQTADLIRWASTRPDPRHAAGPTAAVEPQPAVVYPGARDA